MYYFFDTIKGCKVQHERDCRCMSAALIRLALIVRQRDSYVFSRASRSPRMLRGATQPVRMSCVCVCVSMCVWTFFLNKSTHT